VEGREKTKKNMKRKNRERNKVPDWSKIRDFTNNRYVHIEHTKDVLLYSQ